MRNILVKPSRRFKPLGALMSFVVIFNAFSVNAQEKHQTIQSNSSSSEQANKVSHSTYILGPGDTIEIELVDLPELSGRFPIGPDGTIYLPRLRALYAEGMTVEDLRKILIDKFQAYVIDPQIYVRPVTYRPIRVYVGGEVKRPGYYTLSGLQNITDEIGTLSKPDVNLISNEHLPKTASSTALFPTVFDAIRRAQGITPYSNLSKVQVTRKRANSRGGGRIQTDLNFITLLTEGDESQNIRLLDGDVLNVSKSPTVLRDQLLQASRTNLTPQFLQVYVSGRVEKAGLVTLPQGSSLVQAVDLAGGTEVLHGKVEFIRFTSESVIDRRIFGFKNDAPSGDYHNPVLMSGDVIRIHETPLTKSLAVINEITAPVLGIYSIYSLLDDFSN